MGDSDHTPGFDDATDRDGRISNIHDHDHAHTDDGVHRHPHHHAKRGVHNHAHTLRFERYTYLVSPVHNLDPRFKIIAALVLVVGVVAGPPLRAFEFGLLAALLLAVTLISRVPVSWLLTRSAVVIPITGGIALFAPLGRADSLALADVVAAYSEYAWLIWSILSKSWVSAYTVLLVSTTTPLPNLFKGLRALKMPPIFVTMLTFLYRFTDIFGEQLRTMRMAVTSRAPTLKGWGLVKLYGNLAGNLFIRAYERGERIYAAMLSRGYDGVLPTTDTLTARPADWLLVGTSVLVVAAVLLY